MINSSTMLLYPLARKLGVQQPNRRDKIAYIREKTIFESFLSVQQQNLLNKAAERYFEMLDYLEAVDQFPVCYGKRGGYIDTSILNVDGEEGFDIIAPSQFAFKRFRLLTLYKMIAPFLTSNQNSGMLEDITNIRDVMKKYEGRQWKEIDRHELIYKPSAMMLEKIFSDATPALLEKLIQYYCGERDKYVLAQAQLRECEHDFFLSGLNINGGLNCDRLSLPTSIDQIDTKSYANIVVYCNKDWTLQIRCHSASTQITPNSLVLDFRIHHLPVYAFTETFTLTESLLQLTT